MKINKYAAALLIGSALLSNAAFAAGTIVPTTVTATLTFDSPLLVTPISQINFGLLQASTAGTYTISTAGAVTASNGGAILGGTPTAGSFTVTGSGTQQVNISNTLGAAVGGVTLSNVTCSYGGTVVANCASTTSLPAPGATPGLPLLVGVTATTDTTVTGVVKPTFLVNVFYN